MNAPTVRKRLAALGPLDGGLRVNGRYVQRCGAGFFISGSTTVDTLNDAVLKLCPPAPVAIHRIVDHPEAARAYLAEHRRILAHFAAHGPAARVQLTWTGGRLDRAEYVLAFQALLDKRINMTGGVRIREPRDEEYQLRNDQRCLAEFCPPAGRPRTRHYGLSTTLARRRFPAIDAEMRALRLDD